jgi:hypothetical protein
MFGLILWIEHDPYTGCSRGSRRVSKPVTLATAAVGIAEPRSSAGLVFIYGCHSNFSANKQNLCSQTYKWGGSAVFPCIRGSAHVVKPLPYYCLSSLPLCGVLCFYRWDCSHEVMVVINACVMWTKLQFSNWFLFIVVQLLHLQRRNYCYIDMEDWVMVVWPLHCCGGSSSTWFRTLTVYPLYLLWRCHSLTAGDLGHDFSCK